MFSKTRLFGGFWFDYVKYLNRQDESCRLGGKNIWKRRGFGVGIFHI